MKSKQPLEFKEVFVGREKEIQTALEFLGSTSSKNVLDIWGKSGCGKSKLLQQIYLLWKKPNETPSAIIDFYDIENHTRVGLIKNLSSQLNELQFSKTHSAISNYDKADDLNREKYFDQVFSSFVEIINAAENNMQLTMFFDTFEVIEDSFLAKWILKTMLPAINNNNHVVIAGRNKIYSSDVGIHYIEAVNFQRNDTKSLIQERYKARNTILDIQDEQIGKIYQLSGGHPVLVDLTADWLLEKADPDELLSLENKEKFEVKLVSWIRNLQRFEDRAILLMSVASKRFDEKILSRLSNIKQEDASTVFSNLQRFSFVKYHSLSQSCQLHDEMLNLINNYIGIPINDQKALMLELVNYYKNLISDLPYHADKLMLKVEQLFYYLRSDFKAGIPIFLNDFDESLDLGLYDVSRNYLYLLKELVSEEEINRVNFDRRYLSDNDLVDCKNWIKILDAHLLIENFSINDALQAFDVLEKKFRKEGDEQKLGYCMWGMGKLYKLSGELVHSSQKLNEAHHFYKLTNNLFAVSRINYEIGDILFLMGQYDKARQHLEPLIENGNINLSLQSKILEALANVYRRKGLYALAIETVEKSISALDGLQFKRGAGRRYDLLAMIYREVKDWGQAEKYFMKAQDLLEEEKDYLGIARTYSHQSWFQFIRKDLVGDKKKQAVDHAMKLITSAIDIDIKFGFEGELAGDFHTLFHIIREKDSDNWNWDDARIHIEKVREYSVKSTDGFMFADSAFHLVEYARREKRYEDIPKYIVELETWEKNGFDISFFKARSLYEWGHMLFDESKYIEAFEKYSIASFLHAQKPEGGAGGIFPYSAGLKILKQKIKELPNNQNSHEKIHQIISYWDNRFENDEMLNQFNLLKAALKEID